MHVNIFPVLEKHQPDLWTDVKELMRGNNSPRQGRHWHHHTVPAANEVSGLVEDGLHLPHPHTLWNVLLVGQHQQGNTNQVVTGYHFV